MKFEHRLVCLGIKSLKHGKIELRVDKMVEYFRNLEGLKTLYNFVKLIFNGDKGV